MPECRIVRFINSILAIFLYFSLRNFAFVKCLTEYSNSVPAIALDYKIHVDAGLEDCYYQYVMPDSVLYINMQVIKGGDGRAGFGIKDPNGMLVLPYNWTIEANYDTQTAMGGYYALCIDNTYSKFSAKLVSVYLNSYVAREWERFTDELEKLEISVGNFTSSLSNIDGYIASVLNHLYHSRSRESKDYILLMDNNFNISFWSIVQCIIIICTGAFHVYFIRKLFDAPTTTGKTRVRL